MTSIIESVELRDPRAVIAALRAGAAASGSARCRRGSIDLIEAAPGERLIATGDLHDNPLHLMRLVRAAGLDANDPAAATPAHLTLHELIHGERLVNGLDYSYRVLARIAALKAAFPEHVHVLLANHELAQLTGSLVAKDGVRCNEAFDEALDVSFGDNAQDVRQAVLDFICSLPLAARFRREGQPDILCAHSLPAPDLMDRFDPAVIERDLTEDDYVSRRGSAHLMVWGRAHTPDQLAKLGERWGVGLFILGHEKAESGVMIVAPNAVVLNSDHEQGVYWPIELDGVTHWRDAHASAVKLDSR